MPLSDRFGINQLPVDRFTDRLLICRGKLLQPIQLRQTAGIFNIASTHINMCLHHIKQGLYHRFNAVKGNCILTENAQLIVPHDDITGKGVSQQL